MKTGCGYHLRGPFHNHTLAHRPTSAHSIHLAAYLAQEQGANNKNNVQLNVSPSTFRFMVAGLPCQTCFCSDMKMRLQMRPLLVRELHDASPHSRGKRNQKKNNSKCGIKLARVKFLGPLPSGSLTEFMLSVYLAVCTQLLHLVAV